MKRFSLALGVLFLTAVSTVAQPYLTRFETVQHMLNAGLRPTRAPGTAMTEGFSTRNDGRGLIYYWDPWDSTSETNRIVLTIPGYETFGRWRALFILPQGGSGSSGGDSYYFYYTNIYQSFNLTTNVYNQSTIIETNVFHTYNSSTNIYENTYNSYTSTTNFYDNSVVIYTNTTIIINGTNIATQGDLIWTNDTSISGDGSYGRVTVRPEIDYRYLYPSNILSQGWRAIDGSFVSLFLGTNTVNVTTNSLLYMMSFSGDTPGTVLQLSGGEVAGQELQLMVFTNTWWTNGFTLPANSTNTGGGYVLLENSVDWTPANGSVLWLQWNPPNWVEITRNVFGTNWSTNVYSTTIITNLTVKGGLRFTTNTYITMETNTYITIGGTNVATINPTDFYVPYRASSNTFGDSSLLYTSATNTHSATFDIGSNSAYWTDPRPDLTGRFLVDDRGGGIKESVFFSGTITSNAAAGSLMKLSLGNADSGAKQETYAFNVLNNANSEAVDPTGEPSDGTIGGWFSAEGQGARNIGLSGTTSGAATNNIAVLAMAQRANVNNRTNIALYAEIETAGAYAPVQMGAYIDVGVDGATPAYTNAMLLIDNRDTGYPLIVARTNNGTAIWTIDGQGKMVWGPGYTNVLERSGEDLIYSVADAEAFRILPYRAQITASQNNNPTLYLWQSMTNVSSHGVIRFDKSDSDGRGSLADISAGEAGGWDAGTPSLRAGSLTLRVANDNDLKSRITIWGDSNGIQFGDKVGATVATIENDGAISTGASSTNKWIFKAVTGDGGGVATNITVNINGKDFMFQAW